MNKFSRVFDSGGIEKIHLSRRLSGRNIEKSPFEEGGDVVSPKPQPANFFFLHYSALFPVFLLTWVK